LSSYINVFDEILKPQNKKMTDSVLTTALIDRLTHRCQVLSFTGDGWRVAHRKVIFEDSNQ